MAITVSLSYTLCNAQIKNATTESVKIYGNCGMCESTIEKAGSVKKVAQVDWNKDTKVATLTYDASITSKDEILKRIALAGYDSDTFLAPDDVYNNLKGCCQYERVNKVDAKPETNKMDTHNHSNLPDPAMTEKQEVSQLKSVFNNYFAVKDALVKTDGNTASTKAKELLAAINGVKMETLKAEEHNTWMKVKKDLAFDAGHIAETKNAGQQRDHFTTLSKNMYELMKISKMETPIYYQNCPMFNDGKGANWLSKENAIKNPYYGSQMLTCGKTVETIE